jgi:tRNA nucleotidyltransferase (CCA-adding enzyme)
VIEERGLAERIRSLRGMEAILPVLDGLPPCFLVGGAVRDLLLGRQPVDIDIAVEGDAEAVAAALAAALGGEVKAHERFGTATVVVAGADVVNLARTRRERYPEPGALPEVEPAPLADDLARRDFTVNAIALDLAGVAAADDDALVDPHGGRDDLDGGLIRVLHPASFDDDPTRLLRAVRYAARLGFALEPETARLARAAVAGGALEAVSGARIRDELIDLLAEHEAPRALELLRDLGLDRALHPDLCADPELVASAKLGAAETGADPAVAALAAMIAAGAGEGGASRELAGWVDRLGLPAGARDDVLRAASQAPVLASDLHAGERRPSELRSLLDDEPAEALALMLALGAPAEPILDYLSRLRLIRLEIDGADLLAAGLPESPAIGRALHETLARKLDGEVEGRDAELRTALAIARGEA